MSKIAVSNRLMLTVHRRANSQCSISACRAQPNFDPDCASDDAGRYCIAMSAPPFSRGAKSAILHGRCNFEVQVLISESRFYSFHLVWFVQAHIHAPAQ
jgi:hypothetical protein